MYVKPDLMNNADFIRERAMENWKNKEMRV
jgi:hypothetical protein